MSVTTRPSRINLLAVLCALGCGPIIEQAPFPARPDTVTPGDLLGPYDGRVFETEGDKPIPGAIVVASWTFQRGVGFIGPDGAVVRTTETDNDGNYSFPRLSDLPGGLSTRVASFTLIVYKRDYVGYRSDRYFRDGARRNDFAQRGNRVRLDRFSDEMSHARHLSFIAGPPAVRKAAAWEFELAAAELEGVRRPGRRAPEVQLAPPQLDIWPILTVADVRNLTGYKGEFEEERLTDLARTTFYDSHHFKAVGQPEKYDVALRIWKLGPVEAEAQYKKLKESLPEAVEKNELATKSLRAGTDDILAIAWWDATRGVVAQISCGSAQCANHEAALKIAKLVEDRLDKLGQKEPVKTEEEIGPPKEEQQPLKLSPPELKP